MTTDEPIPQTFVFADLAGFTALTEAMGDQEAADIAGDFSRSVSGPLAEHGGEEVKRIGDALMLRVADAGEAVRLGLLIVHEVGGRHGFPIVRVGMHTGTAVEHDGDWFGTTVNLAARVAGIAGGGEVLITQATSAAAGVLDSIELQARGHHELKNLTEPVLLYEALLAGSDAAAHRWVDPVCRMAVEPGRDAGVLVHEGVEYRFCSLECVRRFAGAPERFTRVL